MTATYWFVVFSRSKEKGRGETHEEKWRGETHEEKWRGETHEEKGERGDS